MKKGEWKRGVLSLILTSFIITILVLVTPANAVEVNAETDKESYKTGETVRFNFKINIEEGENIPVEFLALNLNGVESCRFSVNGSVLSGCRNMNIVPIQVLGFGYGYRQGEGLGFGYGYDNDDLEEKETLFGYGYGYGYVDNIPNELEYSVEWLTENSDKGDYEAVLEVFSSNDEEFTFVSNTAEFEVKVGAPLNDARAEVRAEDGNPVINIKNVSFEGSRKDNVFFNADLRVVDSELAGEVSLNADVYNADGTHSNLEVRAKPKILDEFTNSTIEVEGLARIELKTSKNRSRVGKVSDEVHIWVVIDIANRKVSVSSDDVNNPFSIENIKMKRLDYREFERKDSERDGLSKKSVEVFRLSF